MGSPWYGKWCGASLSESNRHILYIPEGFAHGFYVTSDYAEFVYKCSDYYNPRAERGIRWDDPDLAIEWRLPAGAHPILSGKDQCYPTLAEMPEADLPSYRP
jgi:dTDP-4-dehydrorhamnose 3,5-epimerase